MQYKKDAKNTTAIHRKRFSDEEKLKAVHLVVESGFTFVQAAKQVGCNPQSVRRWVSCNKANQPSKGNESFKIITKKIIKRQVEVNQLKQEIKIVKKATTNITKSTVITVAQN